MRIHKIFMKNGISLIEILIVISCFLFAIIPILGIFSFNADSINSIHSKSLAYSFATEILTQVQRLSPECVPTGFSKEFDQEEMIVKLFISNSETFYMQLSPAVGYSRKLEIPPPASDSKNIVCVVQIQDVGNPENCIKWTRTLSRKGGGR